MTLIITARDHKCIDIIKIFTIHLQFLTVYGLYSFQCISSFVDLIKLALYALCDAKNENESKFLSDMKDIII